MEIIAGIHQVDRTIAELEFDSVLARHGATVTGKAFAMLKNLLTHFTIGLSPKGV
jgi:hypothetical protein